MDFTGMPELEKTLSELKHSMFNVYVEKGLGGIEEMTKFIEKQKESFKQIIKAKTGKAVRKTPKRTNKLMEIEQRLHACALDFENEENGHFSERRPLSAKKTAMPFAEAVQAVVDKQNAIRRAISPARAKPIQQSETPVAAAPKRVLQKPVFKKSELLLQMEAKQKTVINNREEIIRSKAERAKRDREERAQRVLQNKKKEEEREAALKAFRQRKVEAEELCQLHASPAKEPSVHSSRAHSTGPSRARLVHPSPVKSVRVLQEKDRPKPVDVARKPVENTVSTPTKNSIKRRWELSTISEKPEGVGNHRNASNRVFDNDFLEPDHPEEILVDQAELLVQNAEDESQSINGGSEADRHDQEMEVDDVESEDSLPVAVGKGSAMRPKSEDPCLKLVEEAKVAFGVTFVADEHSVSVEESASDRSEAIEKEKEEERDKLDILHSSQLENKKLMNTAVCSSYEVMLNKKPALSNEDNYDIDGLSSEDETDEEDNPKKKVPNWAQSANLLIALQGQSGVSSKMLDAFFGVMKAPNLSEIFSVPRGRYFKRTSSAQWMSPLTNPREGVSRYFWQKACK